MSYNSPFTPRIYQLNARDQIINAVENDDNRIFIVLLPTGMGKTFISTLTLELFFERKLLGNDDKVLFLVQDRKLKHQLYEMAKAYGLARYGFLFLLDDQKALPARMSRQHAALAKFIFATPILLMNAVVGRVKRINKETLEKVKVVIIDEILDVFAQRYGKKRPRVDTIKYIEKHFGNGRDFKQIIMDLKHELEASEVIEYEIDENRLEEQVLREFSSQNYRINKTFEPILEFLGLLDSKSNQIVIGLTASLSHDIKIDLLKKKFGGEKRVVEVHPIGDDFEHFQPAYNLKRIRVFDEWITTIDELISSIKNSVLTANHDFHVVLKKVEERIINVVPDQKEQRLLYWLDRFINQKKKILVGCRFVGTTRNLAKAAVKIGIPSTIVHGSMAGSTQYDQINSFKSGKAKVLFASERLIEKGTDLPEADVGIYYGTTLSLARYEQSLGRIRSNVQKIKTMYTLSYDQTVEAEKSLKRDTMFLELMGKRLSSFTPKIKS